MATGSDVIKLHVTPKGVPLEKWVREFATRSCGISEQTSPVGLPLEGWEARMRDRMCPWVWFYLFSNLAQKRIEMFYITNQSHHWKLNQSDDRIQCPSTNQKAGYKKKQPITAIAITDFFYISPWLIPSSFFPNSYDVLLREMRQAVYREEKPDQTSKDSCRFFTDLQLQYLWQRVQSTRPQKEAWSGPQIQLDLRNWHPSAPSCPTWENGGQAETTDEETSSTSTRTRD